jgi:hypothetical protein
MQGMGSAVCVEPGESLNPTGGGTKQLYALRVPEGWELVFPHVDSCLAIALVLKDGQGFVGGHVGVMLVGTPSRVQREGIAGYVMEQSDTTSFGYPENANLMLRDMLALVPSGERNWIDKLVLLGDPDWIEAVGSIRETLERELKRTLPSVFLKKGDCPGGADLSFNPNRKMLFVAPSRPDSPHWERRPDSFLVELPFSEIAGTRTGAFGNKDGNRGVSWS